jgi:coenzyme F420 biosynthesis associated uncharacterized protein
MPLDWSGLGHAARLVAGTGPRIDGATLLRLRSSIVDIVEEASVEVERESGMAPLPRAEILVVDRHAWIGGNLKTLRQLFGDVDLKGAEARLVAWEGGAFVGLVARAVLGQYDPFRDQLLVVYPNLGEMSDAEGLRWLLFHEVTHVAQFRRAPWIADRISEVGKQLLTRQPPGWTRDLMRQLPDRIPDLVRWLREALDGRATGTPLLELLPDSQREAIMSVHALVTLLEGHATHVTELIARRVLPNHEELNRRIEARRKRPPLLRVLEALAGIDMKRQQYVLGKGFCEAVWAEGGAAALEPAWRGPEWVPTSDELREPDRWLRRVALQMPAL